MQPIMTKAQWDLTVDEVTDRMKLFTRPFVTPLVHDDPGGKAVFGSGTYVDFPPQDRSRMRLLTCEHVTRYQPQKHRPFDCPVLADVVGQVCSDRDPADAATVTISQAVFDLNVHQASPLPFDKFATKHAAVDREVFFFRGLAGENAYLGFGNLDAIITGYCGQEKPGSGDDQIFEIEWNPAGVTVTSGTDPELAKRVKYDHPAGYSGSLVWNTRFVELGANLSTWSPDDAVVTGLLRRWDTAGKTLLVWRVEHLQAWLAQRPSWA